MRSVTEVYLGLGSNIEREKRIRNALGRLAAALGPLKVSPVYESAAVGFTGDAFYNLVVGADTQMRLPELIHLIKQIEDDNGRQRRGPKFGPRTLDIDVLTYGQLVGVHAGIELPRPEITENAYVLRPLSEIAPHNLLPGSDRSFRQLWSAYDQSRQKLKKVDFSVQQAKT